MNVMTREEANQAVIDAAKELNVARDFIEIAHREYKRTDQLCRDAECKLRYAQDALLFLLRDEAAS